MLRIGRRRFDNFYRLAFAQADGAFHHHAALCIESGSDGNHVAVLLTGFDAGFVRLVIAIDGVDKRAL